MPITILEEVKIFLKNIMHWIYAWLFLSFLFFIFPTENSISVQFFIKIQSDLLPTGVHLVVTNPMSAFVSQILFSLLLSFIITFPFFLYKIIKYLSPALFRHEKKLVFQSLLPSVFLFFTGCVFSYYFLIPATFKILYPYAMAINATPFFGVDEFISSVLGLMIVTGVMFLLPVFMILLSLAGFVSSIFWKSKWRHAMMFFLIFTAVITPDGTGVTMMILFLPLMGLYLLGCVLTRRVDKSKINQ